MAIVIQSSLSGQLSKNLQNPLLSSFCLYLVSAILIGVLIAFGLVPLPSIERVRATPTHLWFLGSLFSVVGLGLCYWLMPQIGVARVLVGVVTGQMVVATIISHFGIFGMPVIEINKEKFIGLVLLIVSVLLINKEG
ncbi:PF04657 family protein [Bacteriovorax sp. BSW11_IV]|nr:PF04657 family protein [Bacteriovorax sp. BSW11_IV]